MKNKTKKILINSITTMVGIASFLVLVSITSETNTNVKKLKKPNSSTSIISDSSIKQPLNNLSLPNELKNINELKKIFSEGQFTKSGQDFAITSPTNIKNDKGYIASLAYSIIHGKQNFAFIYSNSKKALNYGSHISKDEGEEQYFIRYEFNEAIGQYEFKRSVKLPKSYTFLQHSLPRGNDQRITKFLNSEYGKNTPRRQLVNVVTEVKYDSISNAYIVYGINGYVRSISLDGVIKDISKAVNFQLQSDGNIKDGFKGLDSYPDKRKFETTGFTIIKDRKYFYGEGQFLTQVNASNDVQWTKHSLFKWNDFNEKFAKGSSKEWSNFYTSNYIDKWRHSVSLVLEGNDSSEILVFGGSGSKFLVLDVSDGSDTDGISEVTSGKPDRGNQLTFRDESSGEQIEVKGKVISGFKNGADGYFLATNKNTIIKLNNNYEVVSVKDAFAGTKPRLTKDSTMKPIINKILPDGLGGYIVYANNTRLVKSDIFNYRFKGITHPNSPIIDKPTKDKYSFIDKFAAPTSAFIPKLIAGRGQFHTDIKKQTVSPIFNNFESYIYHFDASGKELSFNDEWGYQSFNSPTYKDNLVRATNKSNGDETIFKTLFSNLKGIRDVVYDGQGGLYAVHVDNTLRHLNAGGFNLTWNSSANFKESDVTSLASTNDIKAKLDTNTNVQASILTDNSQFAILAKPDGLWKLDLKTKLPTRIQLSRGNIINRNSVFNKSEKIGKNTFLFSGYIRSSLKSFGVYVIFNQSNGSFKAISFESTTTIDREEAQIRDSEFAVALSQNASNSIKAFALNVGHKLEIALVNTKTDEVKILRKYRDLGLEVGKVSWTNEYKTWKSKTIYHDDKFREHLDSRPIIRSMTLAPNNGNLLVFFTSTFTNDEGNNVTKIYVSEYNFLLTTLGTSNWRSLNNQNILPNRFDSSGTRPQLETETSELEGIVPNNVNPIIRTFNPSYNPYTNIVKNAFKQILYSIDDKIYRLSWDKIQRSGFRLKKVEKNPGVASNYNAVNALTNGSELITSLLDQAFKIQGSKITFVKEDGVGGYIIGTNKSIIYRFDNNWQMINYQDFSEYFTGDEIKVNSISEGPLGSFLVSTSSSLKSTFLINRVLGKGFLNFKEKAKTYTDFIKSAPISKIDFTKYSEAWFKNNSISINKKSVPTKDNFALFKKIIKVPQNSSESLEQIEISGPTSDLKIDESKLFTKIKSKDEYFKDIEIEYSIKNDGDEQASLLQSSGQQLWITGKDNFIDLFKLLDKQSRSVAGVKLTAYQIEAFDINNIIVRYKLKGAGRVLLANEVVPDDFSTPKKPNFNNIINEITLYEDSQNDNSVAFFGNDESSFWNTISATTSGFKLAASNVNEPLNSNNYKINAPEDFCKIKLFANGSLELKYSTSKTADGDWFTSEEVEAGSMPLTKNSKVYFSFYVTDKGRGGNSLTAKKPKGFVFRTSDSPFGFYRTIPQEIKNFIIPIVLDGASVKNLSFTLKGNSKDFQITKSFKRAFSEDGKELLEVQLAFGATSSALADIVFDGVKWFSLKELPSKLKDYYDKHDIHQKNKIIWARLRLKKDSSNGIPNVDDILDTTNDGIKYSWDTSPVKIYENNAPVQDLATGNFDLFYRTSTAYAELTSGKVRAVGDTNGAIKIQNFGAFSVERLIKNGIVIYYATDEAGTKFKIYDPDNNGKPIDASKTGKLFVKFKPKSGFQTDPHSQTKVELKIEAKRLIQGISNANLSDATKLIFSGNTKNIEIEEKDTLFATATNFFDNPKNDIKAYVGIEYRENNVAIWTDKDGFRERLKNLSTDDANKLKLANFQVRYKLTSKAIAENFVMDGVLKEQKPHLSEVKKLIDIKNLIASVKDGSGFSIFGGSTNNLSIILANKFSFNSLLEIGVRLEFIYFEDPLTKNGKSTIKSWLVDADNKKIFTKIGSYIPKAENLEKSLLIDIKGGAKYDPYLLAVRFRRTDIVGSEINSIDGKTTTELQSETFNGFEIDTSSITKIINVKSDFLASIALTNNLAALKIDNEAAIFANTNIDEGIKNSNLLDKFEIQYSVGRSLDGTINEWYPKNKFIDYLTTYQANKGPIFLNRGSESSIAGQEEIKARFALKPNLGGKYALSESNSWNLDSKKVKTLFDFRKLIATLKTSITTISAISSEDIRGFTFPLSSEWANALNVLDNNLPLDDKFILLLAQRGIKVQFKAPNFVDSKWVDTKAEIKSLGDSNDLRIRFIIDPTNHYATKYSKLEFGADYSADEGIKLNTKLPQSITIIDPNILLTNMVTVSGDTKNLDVVIDRTKLDGKKIANIDQVEVQFAIGKNAEDLMALDSNLLAKKWFNKAEFVAKLLMVNDDITFPNSNIWVRFGIKNSNGEQNNDNFAISNTSNLIVPISTENVKSFVNIDPFVDDINNKEITFFDVNGNKNSVVSNAISEIILPFDQNSFLQTKALYKSGFAGKTAAGNGVSIQLATNHNNKIDFTIDDLTEADWRFNLKDNIPTNLGFPPKLFVRFFALSNGFVFGQHQDDSITISTVSKVLEIDLTNTRLITLINATKNDLAQISYSGNTKNLVIDDTKFKRDKVFAASKVKILYSLLVNGAAVAIDASDLSKTEFSKTEFTTLLANYPTDIFLKRANPSSGIIEGNAEIISRFEFIDPPKAQASILGFKKVYKLTEANLSDVKNFITLDQIAADLALINLDSKKIIFNNGTTSTTDIKGIQLPKLILTSSKLTELTQKGLLIQFSETSDFKKAISLTSANPVLNPSLQLIDNLYIRFSFAIGFEKISTIEDKFKKLVIVKPTNTLSIPKAIIVDANNLKKVVLSGNTRDLEINEDAVAIPPKSVIKYSFGIPLDPKGTIGAPDETFFTKNDIIALLKTFKADLSFKQRNGFKAKFDLAKGVILSKFEISDKTEVVLTTSPNVKVFVNLKEFSQQLIITGVKIASGSTTKNIRGVMLPNIFQNGGLNALNAKGVALQFTKDRNASTSLEESAPGWITYQEGDQFPIKSLKTDPYLGFRFITTNNQVIFDANYFKNIEITPSIPIEIFLDTTLVVNNIKLSGTTANLELDSSKIFESTRKDQSGKVVVNSPDEKAIITRSIGVEYSVGGIQFLTPTGQKQWLSESAFKKVLSEYKSDIVANVKNFKVRFTSSSNLFILNCGESETCNDNGYLIDSSSVASYIHAEDVIASLKNDVTTFNQEDTTAIISGIHLASSAKLAIKQQIIAYSDYGFKFEYSNQLVADGTLPADNSFGDLPKSLNVFTSGPLKDKPFLWVRLVPTNAFFTTNKANQRPFLLNIKVNRQIKTIASDLAKLDIRGNTKILTIDESKAIKTIEKDIPDYQDSNGNKLVHILYAIGGNPNKAVNTIIKFTPNKIWYTKAELIANLSSYEQDLTNKQIWAKWSINPAYETKDRLSISDRTAFLVENNVIDASSKVKLFVYNHNFINGNPNKITVSGFMDSPTIFVPIHLTSQQSFPIGLKLQYSRQLKPVYTNSSHWLDDLPTKLNVPLSLSVRIVAKPGYWFNDDQKIYQIDTSTIRKRINIVDQLSMIVVKGTTKAIVINDDVALMSSNFSNVALKQNVVLNYSIGIAVNGKLWYSKTDFMALLNSLAGTIPDQELIIYRENMMVRYELKTQALALQFGISLTDQKAINGIAINSFSNRIESTDAKLVNTPDDDIKTYVNLSEFSEYGNKFIKSGGTDHNPTIKFSQALVDQLTLVAAKGQPFDILWTTEKLANGSGDFTNLVQKLFPLAGDNSLEYNLGGKTISMDNPFIALKIVAKHNFVLGDEVSPILTIIDYSGTTKVLDPKINEAQVKFTFKKADGTNHKQGAGQAHIEILSASGEKMFVTTANQTAILGDNLKFVYYVSNSAIVNISAIDDDLFVETIPSNLFVGQFVFAKVIVTDSSKFSLDPSSIINVSARVVGLELDTAILQDLIANAIITVGPNVSTDVAPFDGKSRITKFKLDVTDRLKNYEGISVRFTTSLEFFKDVNNKAIEVDGRQVIKRATGANFVPVKINDQAINDQNDDQVGTYLDNNGVPTAPLISPRNTIVNNLIDNDDGNFIQSGNSQLLYNKQRLQFQFVSKPGYIISPGTLIKRDFEVDNVKFRIDSKGFKLIEPVNTDLVDQASNYVDSKGEATPRDGFGKVRNFLSYTANGVDSTTLSLNSFLAYNQLKLVVTRTSKSDPTRNISKDSLAKFTDLRNEDQITISIVAINPAFSPNIEPLTFTVRGLLLIPTISDFQYLRLDTGIVEANGSGIFKIFTSNIKDGVVVDKPTNQGYKWEYAIVKAGTNFDAKTLKYSLDIPSGLANGDRVLWRLVNFDPNDPTIKRDVVDYFDNKIRNSQLFVSNDTDQIAISTNFVLIEEEIKGIKNLGYVVKGLSVAFKPSVDSVKFSELIKNNFSIIGENRVGQIYQLQNQLDAIKVGLDSETTYEFLLNGEVITSNDHIIKNEDVLEVRLVLTAKAIANNMKIEGVAPSFKMIIKDLKEPKNTFNTVLIVTLSVLGVILTSGLMGLVFILLKRKKLR